MNLRTIARKVGPAFTETGRQSVNGVLDKGLVKTQSVLRGAIRNAAPVGRGELRASIQGRGEALRRTVYSTLRRAIPIDFGWLPASTRAAVRRIRAAGGRGSRKRARALLAGKVAGQHFFYRTFDQLIPGLKSNILAPVGAAIIKELE